MKGRMSNRNTGANELAIKECQALFEKISDFKGLQRDIIINLKNFNRLINDSLSANGKMSKNWSINFNKIESDISNYLITTFKFDYLYNEFTKTIPENVNQEVESSFKSIINQPKIPLLQAVSCFVGGEIATLVIISKKRVELLEKAVQSLEENGVLENEINKRNKVIYQRYFIRITTEKLNKRGTVRCLFLKRDEIVDFFNTCKKQGSAIINGTIINLDTIVKVKISQSLIQQEEYNLFRKKYSIRTDDKLIDMFKDVTDEFYNNEFLKDINKRSRLPKEDTYDHLPTFHNMKNWKFAFLSIRNDLKKGKIKDVLKSLDDIIDEIRNRDLHDTLILLSSQFIDEEQRLMHGLSRSKEERNRIILAIIELVNDTEKKINELQSNADISTSTPFMSKSTFKPHGYCIRSGKEIPFDIERPLSFDSYKMWSQFGDGSYPEKFCHFSGEPSHGKTCFNFPILNKNWQKAKEIHGF